MIRVGVVERCPVYRYGLVTLLTTAGMHVLSASASDDGSSADVDVLVIGTDPLAVQSDGMAARSDGTPVVLLTSVDSASPAPPVSDVTVSISRDADIDAVVTTIRELAARGPGKVVR
jgi:hypothetical protein